MFQSSKVSKSRSSKFSKFEYPKVTTFQISNVSEFPCLKILEFQSLHVPKSWVSKFQNFGVPKFQDSKVSKFEYSKVFISKIPKFQSFHVLKITKTPKFQSFKASNSLKFQSTENSETPKFQNFEILKLQRSEMTDSEAAKIRNFSSILRVRRLYTSSLCTETLQESECLHGTRWYREIESYVGCESAPRPPADDSIIVLIGARLGVVVRHLDNRGSRVLGDVTAIANTWKRFCERSLRSWAALKSNGLC